ncbi:MAG: substrate-binding domain-containing protein [Phycisphaerae bacterium]|nr:substrate-binding domain-containing protein [Phycisphaerae bacterium]
MKEASEEYMQKHPGRRIKVHRRISYGALENLTQGKTDVAFIEYPLRKYVDKLWEKTYPDGKKPAAEYVFAQTALGIVVHKRNPLRSLTYSQIRDIWSGKIGWRNVGGGAGRKITIYTMQPSKNLGGCLLSQLLLDYRKWTKACKNLPTTSDVIESVAQDVNGIGIIVLRYDITKNVKLVSIAKDADSLAVKPTVKNIVLEKYPLVRQYKFILSKKSPSAAYDFCRYVCSEKSEAAFKKWGLFPIAIRNKAEAQKRLREMKAGKGPKVRVVGAKGCGKLLDGLAVDYVMATAVIQMKYSGGEERAAVGRFATAGAKAAAGEKVSANSPQLLVLDGAMSEKTRDAYREKLAAAKPVRHVLGARGVAVIVNPKNPLKSITAEQVVEVFRGKAKSWADVAGAGQGGKTANGGKAAGDKNNKKNKNTKSSQIVRYSPDPTKDAVVKYFHREILQANRCRSVQYRKTADSVIGFVASNPSGIGVIDVNDLKKTAAQTGVKVLAIGSAGKAALPTPKNLLAGKYPLARQVIMYVSPNADKATKDFVKFILTTEPSETFAKAGLVTTHSKITMPKPKLAKKKPVKGKTGKDKKSDKKDDKNKNLPKRKKDKEKSQAPGGW